MFYPWTSFVIRHLISQTADRRPVESISVVGPRCIMEIWLIDILPTLHIIFTESQKNQKFDLDFRPQTPCNVRFDFETKESTGNIKDAFTVYMISLNIDSEISPIHPLNFLGGQKEQNLA